jgi:PTS system mannose-specific IIA component
MASILIIAHAPLASALKAVALHTFAEAEPFVQALDVLPQDDPEAFESRALLALQQAQGLHPDRAEQEVLVLSDACGASPCNVCSRMLGHVPAGLRMRVLSGVNVPMLWRAVSYAHLPLDELAEKALSGGIRGMTEILPE